ncbi:MAG: glutamate racemase [Treponema sp.]|jgi:glutamate racemase|nr:glutamate racemase [Treponema sp.]
MDNRPVLFIDSGIGGIPYCRDFLEKNPRESVWYLADRQNFPYGTRSREELTAILTVLVKKLSKIVNPKIIVLACNTAALSALDSLRQKFPQLTFVGTVPAIKPAASASKSGKVGLLGTERTINDPYNQSLADNGAEIVGIAAPGLVKFVEMHFEESDTEEKTELAKKYVDLFRAAGADTLVLGCTHFLYLLEEFRREAEPSIKVFDSVSGITNRLESLLDDNGGALRTDSNYPENWLLLTGTEPPDSLWQKRAEALGFNIFLLDEA